MTRDALKHRLPLCAFDAELTLPRDMAAIEAERICTLVRSLALPSPSAPGPEVPEEVRSAITALTDAHAATDAADQEGSPEDFREAMRDADVAYCALLSAISRAIADAREGALREAAEVCEKEAEEYEQSAERCDAAGHHYGATGDLNASLACRFVARQLRALASPPPANEEGGR